MNFNSWQFLLFLPVVVGLFWLLPHKFRWLALLIASYYFYMSWDVYLIFLILTTTVVCYLSAILIERTENKRLRKTFLIIALVVCFGILFFFKYFNFLAESIVTLLRVFSLDVNDFALSFILPVGISFYTFQTLSYVVDVYRGDFQAEKHFGYFALYVVYFPQLVAGPIERPGDLLPQLKTERKFDSDDFLAGLKWLISGFFRKCVVADFCAVFVNRVYGDLSGANGLAVWIASALFLIQIYNDFAGYSEIAMGSARLMGVKLTQNFDRPLSSCSFTEFFRRWHITLNQWFTQYVYIPLGGNRKGKWRKILNTLIVFSLCGLWHGANWTFVLWGLSAGIFVSLESVLRKPLKALAAKWKIDLEHPFVKLVRRGLVLTLFTLCSVLFRAQNLGEIGVAFAKIFTDWELGTAYIQVAMTSLSMDVWKLVQVFVLILAMAFIYFFPRTEQKQNEAPMSLLKENNVNATASVFVYAILAIALFWLGLLANSDVSAFTYFQF